MTIAGPTATVNKPGTTTWSAAACVGTTSTLVLWDMPHGDFSHSYAAHALRMSLKHEH